MTIRGIHDGEDSVPSPNQSLRERALATFREKSASVNNEQFTTEESQRAIHELQVHQIELEMQNEELRQSRLALEDSRQRYRDLYDVAPVGYCIVSTAGLVLETNRTLLEMLGTSEILLVKERFSKFVDEKDLDSFYLLRRRLLASIEPQTCELRLRKSDGTRTWVQLSVSLAPGLAEEAHLRVALMDIDARIQAEKAKASLEAQLRESQKMEAIGTLAGGIAHDFNNILAVILGNSELACSFCDRSDQKTFHCISEIQKAGERARDLVKQLLAFCRRQPTDRVETSLVPIIEDSIRLLRSTMPARVSLSFTSDLEVPNVLADATQIEQVVINLATNAMQAMNGRPGSIKIHLDTIERRVANAETDLQSEQTEFPQWQKHDIFVRLTFADDGPGMDAAVIERIFEPFFTTKPVDEGTGLGLAVVHGIVLAHDGEISVKSEPGHGATFTIYFPSAHSPHIEGSVVKVIEPSSVPTSAPNADTHCTILYVDDDDMVLRSIVNLLGHFGIEVRGYSDQQAALSVLRTNSREFDVVVTDYNMPGMSGLELAKLVREIQPNVPVIVTSGFIDEELHAHAEEAGVRALIPKPFSAKYFSELVRQLLKPSS